jgi:hypothetical protein
MNDIMLVTGVYLITRIAHGSPVNVTIKDAAFAFTNRNPRRLSRSI